MSWTLRVHMRSVKRFAAAVRCVNSSYLSIRALRQRACFMLLPPAEYRLEQWWTRPLLLRWTPGGDIMTLFTLSRIGQLHRGSFLVRPHVSLKFKVSWPGWVVVLESLRGGREEERCRPGLRKQPLVWLGQGLIQSFFLKLHLTSREFQWTPYVRAPFCFYVINE